MKMVVLIVSATVKTASMPLVASNVISLSVFKDVVLSMAIKGVYFVYIYFKRVFYNYFNAYFAMFYLV